MHALAIEGVAVELGDDFVQTVQIAAVVQNEKKIGRVVFNDFGALAFEDIQDFYELIGRHIFEKNHLQRQAVVLGHVAAVDGDGDGLTHGVGQPEDAVDVAVLRHPVAVDAQDQIQQVACVEVLGFSIGIDRNAAHQAGRGRQH